MKKVLSLVLAAAMALSLAATASAADAGRVYADPTGITGYNVAGLDEAGKFDISDLEEKENVGADGVITYGKTAKFEYTVKAVGNLFESKADFDKATAAIAALDPAKQAAVNAANTLNAGWGNLLNVGAAALNAAITTVKTNMATIADANPNKAAAVSAVAALETALANYEDAQDFLADGDVFRVDRSNFVPSFDVKGPAEVTSSNIKKDTFKYFYNAAENELVVEFVVEFKLAATNETSVDYKGLVLKYGFKTDDLTSRNGFATNKTETVKEVYEVGYTYETMLEQYDEIVDLFDDMREYEEKYFEYELAGTDPVIAKSVVKFLQKNLKDTEYVIFYYKDDSTYFDGTKTLILDGADFDALPVAHINIKTNANDVEEISDILTENDVEYMWYNFAVARDIEAGHVLETRYDDPVVYLYNADEDALYPATMDEEYEDLAYGDVSWTGVMGQYLITEGAIPEEIFVPDEEPEEPAVDEEPSDLVDEDGNAVVENPGTGSSNAISLAVALAVVSMAAAGVVASKKASK